ncbi:MAG: alpha/beta hydrolase [Acidobacteria bacterium]|nr:alpha/beta hydrolase [Acidobacteriota bacterium]
MMKVRIPILVLLALLTVSGTFGQTNPLSAAGRFRAGWRSVTVTRPNNTTFTARLFYPATTNGQNATYDPSGGPYPAITFGHGFFQAVSNYQSTLEHLATHGYFVIASDSEGGLLPSHQNFANDLRQSLTYLESENSNSASTLFNQIQTSRFGASGHSMGGGASILAASQDPRIKALANLAAAETNPSAVNAMPSVTVPASLISASSDTIVPVASNGQLMFNAGPPPKLLPVIQGGWHCGFIDANGFGCDSGTIARSEQLAETRRLLTSFFNLYLKSDETVWKQVWGNELNNSLVQSQTRSGIELSPSSITVAAPVGVLTTIPITVTNRGASAASFTIFIEQRRWLGIANPAQTALLSPNQSTVVNLAVRRLWKTPRMLNSLIVSARSNSDNLTRSLATITLE